MILNFFNTMFPILIPEPPKKEKNEINTKSLILNIYVSIKKAIYKTILFQRKLIFRVEDKALDDKI